MWYKNPKNGDIKSVGGLAWLWCLLFGPFYFLFKGNIMHFFLSLIGIVVTWGISHIIYPFFVYSINKNWYIHHGWAEVPSDEVPNQNTTTSWYKLAFIGVGISFVLLIFGSLNNSQIQSQPTNVETNKIEFHEVLNYSLSLHNGARSRVLTYDVKGDFDTLDIKTHAEELPHTKGGVTWFYYFKNGKAQEIGEGNLFSDAIEANEFINHHGDEDVIAKGIINPQGELIAPDLDVESYKYSDQYSAEEIRQGVHCINVWDGSHPQFKREVRRRMLDPESFEHIETRVTPVSERGMHKIYMDYRARNGLGGVGLGTASGIYSNSDCTHGVLSID